MMFICDPDKNTRCKKTSCVKYGGYCRHTKHLKYFDYKRVFLFLYAKWVRKYCPHWCFRCRFKEKRSKDCIYTLTEVLSERH